MKRCFIHSAVSISPQDTFETQAFLSDTFVHTSKKVPAVHPNYRDYISPSALRRMAPVVKMGVTAATKALEIANVKNPDAIITGTGMGCIADTEKFLNAIIANNEAFLTPTSFIQSTHNTVGAQIALGLGCKAYNNTYVHANIAFESALLDATVLLQQDDANSVLVGGMDELGNEFVDYVALMESKDPNGIQVPFGEGAICLVLSSEPQPKATEILDIETINTATIEDIRMHLTRFLTANSTDISTIDAVVLGRNGDGYDAYYDAIAEQLPSETKHIRYKHLCGEFYTASAFGIWIAIKLLEHQEIPKSLSEWTTLEKPLRTILVYNQFKGRNHSFILLTKC